MTEFYVAEAGNPVAVEAAFGKVVAARAVEINLALAQRGIVFARSVGTKSHTWWVSGAWTGPARNVARK